MYIGICRWIVCSTTVDVLQRLIQSHHTFLLPYHYVHSSSKVNLNIAPMEPESNSQCFNCWCPWGFPNVSRTANVITLSRKNKKLNHITLTPETPKQRPMSCNVRSTRICIVGSLSITMPSCTFISWCSWQPPGQRTARSSSIHIVFRPKYIVFPVHPLFLWRKKLGPPPHRWHSENG